MQFHKNGWCALNALLSENGGSMAEWVTLSHGRKVLSSIWGVCLGFLWLLWLLHHQHIQVRLSPRCLGSTFGDGLLRALSSSIQDWLNADSSFCYEWSIKFTATLRFAKRYIMTWHWKITLRQDNVDSDDIYTPLQHISIDKSQITSQTVQLLKRYQDMFICFTADFTHS